MATITVLAVGDVVGDAAVVYLEEKLRKYADEVGADVVVVNGENAAPQNGIDPITAERIFAAGADVITTGNHVWRKNSIKSYLDENPRIIRPANYPAQSPGLGYTIVTAKGYRVLVINILGTVYMEPLSCPFEAAQKILEAEDKRYDLAIIDFHAEATSEKIALATYFDSLNPSKRVAAVFGTHTHVQTSDARILTNGTAFITDLGMTGPDNSILGIKPADIINKLKNKMPAKFEPAEGKITAHAAILNLTTDGIGTRIEYVEF